VLRGDIGNKCLGTPPGNSDVSGKSRAPSVAAKMMAIYSGSKHDTDMAYCSEVAALLGG
jgi:hypothetical protein